MNEVFRPVETIINARNSYLKLNHPFRKTSTGKNGLSYIGHYIGSYIEEIRKFKYFYLKHYYLKY